MYNLQWEYNSNKSLQNKIVSLPLNVRISKIFINSKRKWDNYNCSERLMYHITQSLIDKSRKNNIGENLKI